jgi:hypothetical protein
LDVGIPNDAYPLNKNTYAFDFDVSVSGTGVLVEPDFTHSHPTAEKTWTVIHTLDERYPLVIVTDRKFNRIIPEYIAVSNSQITTINFGDHKVNGYAMFKKPDYDHIQRTISATWTVDHNLGDAVMVQTYLSDDYPYERMMMPNNIKHEENKATITFDGETVSGRAVVSDVEERPDYWDFNHNLGNASGAMVQTWDSDLYNIWPSASTSDGNYVEYIQNTSPSATYIKFDDYQTGYAFACSADYIHEQTVPSAAWLITHNLLDSYPVVDVLDYDLIHLPPSAYTVETIDDKTVNITFSESASGYALLGIPDYTYTTSPTATSAWDFHHYLWTDFNYITVYDGDTNKTIQPTSIRHLKWTNNVELLFDTEYYGQVSLKGASSASMYLQRVHNLNEILSPHIKIELDLTEEPMETDGIIYKDRLDKLIELWDHCRPISRIFQYSMVISPSVDFYGNRTSLYPYSGNIQFTTRCTKDIISQIEGSYVYIVSELATTINVFHRLETNYTIVQCFMGDNLVEPDEIVTLNINTVKVIFDSPFSGYIVVSKADVVVEMKYNDPETVPLSAGYYYWAVSGGSFTDTFDVIPQITDEYKTKILPEAIIRDMPEEE